MRLHLSIILIIFILICSCDSPVPPEKAPIGFSWDFCQKKTFAYTYEQTVESSIADSKIRKPDSNFTNGKGNLTIRVKDSLYADLSITELATTMIELDGEGNPTDTLLVDSPPMIVQDMDKKGFFKSSNQDDLFKILLPLPHDSLKMNESVTFPIELPLSINGSVLYIKGGNTLSYVKDTIFLDEECAILKGVLDISELDIPEELSGMYSGESIGNSTYYFSTQNGYYIGADVEMNMKAEFETPANEENEYGDYTLMISNNTFKIRFKELIQEE